MDVWEEGGSGEKTTPPVLSSGEGGSGDVVASGLLPGAEETGSLIDSEGSGALIDSEVTESLAGSEGPELLIDSDEEELEVLALPNEGDKNINENSGKELILHFLRIACLFAARNVCRKKDRRD